MVGRSECPCSPIIYAADQPTHGKTGLTPDEVGAFVFLGVLLACVLTAGCITWWVNRCRSMNASRKKAEFLRNGGMFDIGMEEIKLGEDQAERSGENVPQDGSKLDIHELSSLPEDESFGTFLIHIPGSSTLPYCSGLVALSHPQYTIK